MYSDREKKRRHYSDSSSDGDSVARKHRSRKSSNSDRRRRSRSESSSDDDNSSNKRRKTTRGRGRSKSNSEDDTRSKKCAPQQFNFDRHKSKLTKMFFRPTDLIQESSKEYRDFWTFLAKYQALERKSATAEPHKRARQRSGSVERSSVLSIPLAFDREHGLPFELLPRDPAAWLDRIGFQDTERGGGAVLGAPAVREFRQILATYMMFLQREKFARLRKLREAQASLPIAEYRQHILTQLESNQVIIVAGDTGCGKSTQVPQYLLQAGYTNIACTQPRRIACISLANRVSYETLNQYGQEIGYQIRFEKKRAQNTKVVFLTEGLLLRQITSDPTLSGYNVIVLDEVHERHLHGDFLLGVVKCLLQHREDLRVILMSATINISLFSDYFHGEAPVIQVPGRLYPIMLEYHPIPSVEDSDRLNPAPYVRILQIIDKKYPTTERGDLLIFLSGITEITKIVDACRQYAELNNKWIVLPLHSTLSLADQEKVFDYPPEGVRKVIVSTNIAETSVTIDGVRFVCDSGKVKEMTYDPVCKMQRLKEFWVSRASAEQRKGRAGRTGPGVCYRLYSEAEYTALSPYSKPEIERVPLDSLVLQMVAMGLPNARKFPFIEPPPAESLENSILVLKEQGAMTPGEQLTPMGRLLSNLPVDVAIGKILIMGSLFHQVESVLTLAAALSVQSPFTNQAYRDTDCMAARRSLDSDHGDPFTLLNAFREWLRIKSDERENSRKWCKKRGLEEQRFYEMIKLRRQFEDLLRESGLLQERGGEAALTSSERMARHGEIRQLKEAKRNHAKEGTRKRKTLRMDTGEWEEEEEAAGPDMGDVDFRLRNDPGRVRQLLESSRAVSYKDLTMLKLVLTSGLYPQFAVADEFNSYKAGQDQLFHTRVKPFNVLHPNSIFASQPEVLQLESLDILNIDGFSAKNPPSTKHQLLVYISLLETTKPYLTASIRIPALAALMLFAHAIETTGDVSRIIFDAWLEVKFADAEQGQNQLVRAIKLRNMWLRLLNLKLEAALSSIKNDEKSRIEQAELEASLGKGLVDFLHTETVYGIKRLLPADLKTAYVGRGLGWVPDSENPFCDEEEYAATAHEEKGGMQLHEHVTYNCLVGDFNANVEAEWLCPICQDELTLRPLERMNHYAHCSSQEEAIRIRKILAEQRERERAADPRCRAYFCPTCHQHLTLAATEILKHKKTCPG